MTRFISISKVAAVVMAFCTLAVSSCAKPVEEKDVLEVSVKTPSVASGKGQMFVNVRCNTSWTLILMDAEDDSDIDWASLNIDSGKGNMSNVILSYQVNDSEDSRRLKIVLDNGSRWTSCMVEQAGSGQQPEPEPDPVPQPDTDLAKVSWLELPAMDNPDLGYYSYSFEMNGKEYRNYSFGWSQKDLVALWMAYPLCSMYTNKTVSRTDAWAYDPILGPEYSPAPFGGYGGSYARGHQVPSADRLCSYNANVQTFYGSNMTPQLNAHNEGIWQTLESKVRTLANTSDTTYVVTGCVVDGSTTFTQDSDGKKMTVPVGYYKVLLRYSKSSTISTWAAMAFYTEHKSYSGSTSLRSLAMSVDELEEMLGMDFFVNLPAKLGEERAAALEAEDPLTNSIWGL
ncbi:MAG: DNA/RNA non-specific endonuclease [Bacteroidales bacterium]|nr:DNA/RNA non-specific endonuclease [Bacteroidales bacterium]MBQ8854583.1 DNA/RNA non-specific endonuclease [Bacteroidales bacterium]